MNIELIYEKTCPNVEAAREQIRNALSQLNLPTVWLEWEISQSHAPSYVHGYGSPTVLVNGKDVTGASADKDDMCCRIYADTDTANRGIPSIKSIISAVRASMKLMPEQHHE